MVHIGRDTAATMRAERQREYGQYVADDEIYIDGVLAFAKGYPVPVSHVEEYPQLLEEDENGNVPVISREEYDKRQAAEAEEAKTADSESGPPAMNAGRSKWVKFAEARGADAADLAPVKDGGLSRDDLAAKYGPAQG